MIDFLKLLAETKGQLKSLLTKESTEEQINKISAIDKQLDSLSEAYSQQKEENESLKDTLIESVKSTGFKVNGSQSDDSGIDQNPKSMDEIMEEELNKITAKQ